MMLNWTDLTQIPKLLTKPTTEVIPATAPLGISLI